MRKENPAAYHLIDEKFHSYGGRHEESGWDTDHRGAGEFYAESKITRSVKSVNTKYPTFRRRNITEETSGKVTLETVLRIVSGDGFYFGLWGDKGDEKEAFVLRQKQGFVRAGNVSLFKVDNEWHYLKLVCDIDKGVCSVHLDGKNIKTCVFTGNAKSICKLEYGYAAEDVGQADVSMELKMYKNYIFCDSIVPKYSGNLPQEYVVEKTGKASVQRRTYKEGSKYGIYEIKANKDSKISVTRSFERTQGVFGYEMKYLVPAQGGKMTFDVLCNGQSVLTLFDEYDELCCTCGSLRKHSGNVWQTLRVEADISSGTALVRLNGKIVTTVALNNEAPFVDGIRISYESIKASGMMFTHLKAFPIPPLPNDYVPEPVVPQKKSDCYVGMNICSLWREGTHYGWDCVTPFPENKPVLGYYDEGITETADWEIKFMAEHGIDFQLYCWYASEYDRPMVTTGLSSAIHDGHMLAKYSDKVKMALLWEAQSGERPRTFEGFKKYFVPYFIDYFFSDARYMTIDGAAIMSIYGIMSIIRDMGGTAEVKKCLDYLRKEVVKLGYKDLIIMCCGDTCEEFLQCGVDASHAYGWGAEGYDVEYTKHRNLSNMERGYVHTVPTVSVGFNIVGWRGTRSPMMTPDDMKTTLNWCKDEILSTFEKNSWKSKLVMLSTWNEYGEGTYIMPADGLHGFGYLDAVRSVFMKDVPHVDVRPTKDQLDRIGILFPHDRALIAPQDKLPEDNAEYPVIRRYEFKTKQDLDKWEIHRLSHYEIKDGRLFGHSDEADPYMILHDDEFFPIATEKVGKIVANCRTYKPVNAMCCIQHSYMLEKDKWYPYQSARTSVPDKVVPLVIDPRTAKDISWHGSLYGFRFDPVWKEGDFELESIEFHAAPPSKTLVINGNITDMSQQPYEQDGTWYIPFDTKSKLKRIANMYYEWDKTTEMLTIFGDKRAVFLKDCDVVSVDGKDIALKKPLTFVDGIPHVQADILCDILNMNMTVSEYEVRIDSK